MLTKATIVAAMAEAAGISQVKADAAFNALRTSITNELVSGSEVRLSGIGTLKPSERAARKGRNPSTGEEIDIAAANVVKFSASKDLKDAMNS
ncbi:DNA-binding protein [Yersinia phage fHe-Yen8-01]|nr:DNA-binding protein [Yersinia phage fHe-Yen8-01]